MRSLPAGRWLLLLVSLFSIAACKPSHYEGHGVSWKPPRGVSFESEGTAPAGATGQAKFSGGVTLTTWAREGMPDADDQHLEDVTKKVVPANVTPISKRSGSLPAGKVVRFVWREGDQRTLLYYLPAPNQVVVVSLTAPESRFSALEDHFDLSLNSLKLN